MNLNRYLERIGYDGPVEPGRETLRRLHRQHLLRVPFENLDIHLQRPFTLETPALYDKIVERRRGGFCYELNGLFAWLLRELGFDVSLHSARVVGSDGRPGPEFDHMTLLVRLKQRWLADVGFGESFLDPMRLDSEEPYFDGHTTHRIAARGSSAFAVEQLDAGQEWAPQYVFTTRARRIDEFDEMCVYHQTSPDSHFTRKRLCTLATAEGRITLAGLTLIETVGGERRETPLAGDAEWRRTLRDVFGVNV